LALCRRSIEDDESKSEEGSDKDMSNIVNDQGVIEYTKATPSQLYHVEHVLSLVDVANLEQGTSDKSLGMGDKNAWLSSEIT